MSYNIDPDNIKLLDDLFAPQTNIKAQITGYHTGVPPSEKDLNERFESLASGLKHDIPTNYKVQLEGDNYGKDLNEIFAKKGSTDALEYNVTATTSSVETVSWDIDIEQEEWNLHLSYEFQRSTKPFPWLAQTRFIPVSREDQNTTKRYIISTTQIPSWVNKWRNPVIIDENRTEVMAVDATIVNTGLQYIPAEFGGSPAMGKWRIMYADINLPTYKEMFNTRNYRFRVAKDPGMVNIVYEHIYTGSDVPESFTYDNAEEQTDYWLDVISTPPTNPNAAQRIGRTSYIIGKSPPVKNTTLKRETLCETNGIISSENHLLIDSEGECIITPEHSCWNSNGGLLIDPESFSTFSYCTPLWYPIINGNGEAAMLYHVSPTTNFIWHRTFTDWINDGHDFTAGHPGVRAWTKHAIDFLTRYKPPSRKILVYECAGSSWGYGKYEFRYYKGTSTAGSFENILSSDSISYISPTRGNPIDWSFDQLKRYDAIIFVGNVAEGTKGSDFITNNTLNAVSEFSRTGNKGIMFITDGGNWPLPNHVADHLYSAGDLGRNARFSTGSVDLNHKHNIRVDDKQWEVFGDIFQGVSNTYIANHHVSVARKIDGYKP